MAADTILMSYLALREADILYEDLRHTSRRLGAVRAPAAPLKLPTLAKTLYCNQGLGSGDLDPEYNDCDFPYTSAEKQDGHPGFLKELQIARVHHLRMMLEAEGYTERLDTFGSCGRASLTSPCPSRRSFSGEKWRAETKLDDTVPTWGYLEKAELAKYYKQFYHRTDKVALTIPCYRGPS
ncbi:hypothetical protein Purlil1_14239 [Purpureocillium lilacinum]|uniref:Uncharacterized protein n=1 Tax=Purpureocillium lilacinum TaxID=33203 RepID=A0ABR0BBU4_PURLI|nr:hypothetical protein Purlil1_14239 [Purpureocillium lilacinum]